MQHAPCLGQRSLSEAEGTLERAFGLGEGALAEAWSVLRDYGNMSATTVMFVLERMLAQTRTTGEPWKRALMNALGPGFTAGFLVLDNR